MLGSERCCQYQFCPFSLWTAGASVPSISVKKSMQGNCCRKLMGHKPTLQDLKDVHPTIHASLQKLLAEDDAAQLGLVFQVL